MDIKPVSIQDKYEVHGLIGTGGQANVYKGIEKLTEREVAIKVIKIEDVNNDLEREIELLVKMRSPFIISFIEALKYESEIWVIMEYCACGSMKDIYALQRHALNEDQVKDVVSFAVLGLHHIHNLRCLHRDIKAANILLSGDGVAKLADFGVSAELDEGASTRHSTVGSAHWMSPEMINGVGYDGSADIWSLGITIIELVEGNPPNIKLNPRRTVTMTVTNPAPKLKNSGLWSADMKDFVDRCLQKDPKHRANTRELLQHRWISQAVQSILINRGSTLLQELYFTVNNLKLKLMEDYENSLLTAEQKEAKIQAKVAAEEARLKAIADAEEAIKLKAKAEAEEEEARLKAIADQEAEEIRLKAKAEAEEIARLKAIADEEEALRLKAIADKEAEEARLKAIAEAEEIRLKDIAKAEEIARLKAIADEEEALRLKAIADKEAEEARLKVIAEAEEARLKAIEDAKAEELRLKEIEEKKKVARLKAIEEAKITLRNKAIADAEVEFIKLKTLAKEEEIKRLSFQAIEISELQSHLENLESNLIQSNDEKSRLKELIESANEKYLLSEIDHKKLSNRLEEIRKDYDNKTDSLFDFLAEQQNFQHKLIEEEAVSFHNNERKNTLLLELLPVETPKPAKFEDILLKKGKSLGIWQKRPYVIDNGVLMYISKGVVKHRYAFSASTIFLYSETNNNVLPCGIYLSDERAGWSVQLKCENDESKLKWVEVIQNHLSYVLSIVNSQTIRETLDKLAEDEKMEEKKKEEDHEHVLFGLRKQVHDSEIRRILIENEIAQLSSDLEKSLQELNISETNIVQSKILLTQLTQSYEKIQFDNERIQQEILTSKQHLENIKQNHQKINELAQIENDSIVLKEISLLDIEINEDLIIINEDIDSIPISTTLSQTTESSTPLQPLSSSSSTTTTINLERKIRSISQPPVRSFEFEEIDLLPERRTSLRLSQSESTYDTQSNLDILPPPLTLQISQSEIKHNSINRHKKDISQEFKSLMAEKLSQKRELMRLKLFATEAGLLVNKMEEKVRNIVEEKENLDKQNQDNNNNNNNNNEEEEEEEVLTSNVPFQQDKQSEQQEEEKEQSDEQKPSQLIESNAVLENIINDNNNNNNNKDGGVVDIPIPVPENILMISQQSEDDDDFFNTEQYQHDHQDNNEEQKQQQKEVLSNNQISEALLLEQEVERITQLKVEIEKAASLLENIEKMSLDSSNNNDETTTTTDTRPVSLHSNRSSSSHFSNAQNQEIYEARMTKIAQDEADKWEIATYETLDALRLPSISYGTTAVVNGQLRQSVDLRSASLIGNGLSGPLRHVGWIYKQSEYLQSWNKRYFVLENCVLSYYYNTHSIGHTYEITPKTRLLTVIPSQPLCLKIDDPVGNWNLIIKCENETSKQEWIWRLQEHIKYRTNPPTNNISSNLDILAEGDENEDEFRRTLDDRDESRTSIPPPTPTSINSSPKKKRSIPSIQQSDALTLSQFGTQKGWGSKQGAYFWNPRYFILCNATLTYFLSDSPSDLETPRGTYIFTPSTKLITQSMDSSLPNNSICLQDSPGEWSITMKFDNEEITEQWHRSISIHLMFISTS